jgi:hypothetical protein
MGGHGRPCIHRVPGVFVDSAGCGAFPSGMEQCPFHATARGISDIPCVDHGAGFRMFLAANSLALCYYLGPSRSASLALKCALVCAGAKFAQIVITSSPSKVRMGLAHLPTGTAHSASDCGCLPACAVRGGRQGAVFHLGLRPAWRRGQHGRLGRAARAGHHTVQVPHAAHSPAARDCQIRACMRACTMHAGNYCLPVRPAPCAARTRSSRS